MAQDPPSSAEPWRPRGFANRDPAGPGGCGPSGPGGRSPFGRGGCGFPGHNGRGAFGSRSPGPPGHNRRGAFGSSGHGSSAFGRSDSSHGRHSATSHMHGRGRGGHHYAAHPWDVGRPSSSGGQLTWDGASHSHPLAELQNGLSDTLRTNEDVELLFFVCRKVRLLARSVTAHFCLAHGVRFLFRCFRRLNMPSHIRSDVSKT